MELRQLIYFEAVVRYGGFTRAAGELRIAQPAISAQIKRLESELGTRLLNRTTREVSPTKAGDLLVARVRTVLAELDAARAELAELSDVLGGRLRIGATPVVGGLDLPEIMTAFRRQHGAVALSLRTGLLSALRAALDAGEIDLLIGPLDPELDRYPAKVVAAERTVLVTRPDRSGKPIRRLADAADRPFACLPPGSGLHAMLMAAAAAAGFTPRIEFEADHPARIRELVASGLCVAVMAESTARAPGPAVEVHELPDIPPHPPIGCVLPFDRPADPAARAFAAQVAASHQGPAR